MTTLLSIQNGRSEVPALVVLDAARKPVLNNDGTFPVQIGAFSTRDRAEQFILQSAKYLDVKLHVLPDPDDQLFKVQTQLFEGSEHAKRKLAQIRRQSLFSDAFIPANTSIIYENTDFIYQVWLEGISAEFEQSYLNNLTSASSISNITVTSKPDKNIMVFGNITDWMQAIELREQLSKIPPPG